MSSEDKNNGGNTLSKNELEVYDRQIRLWGYDGQKKLSSLNVLLIGLQGLGAEIAKNLILGGIKSITFKDHTDVSILDSCSQFLISTDNKERNRAKASLAAAQKLNPNVKVTVDTTPIPENDNFVTKFDIIIATDCLPLTYKKLSEDCRKHQVKLFIADVYGLLGYFFQDLNFKHSLYYDVFFRHDERTMNIPDNRPMAYYLTSAIKRFHNKLHRKPNPNTCEEDTKQLKSIVSAFEQIDRLENYEDYFCELFCQLSPTTSIIGATVAQAAMNTTMEKTIDELNVFFYDHVENTGSYYKF